MLQKFARELKHCKKRNVYSNKNESIEKKVLFVNKNKELQNINETEQKQ